MTNTKFIIKKIVFKVNPILTSMFMSKNETNKGIRVQKRLLAPGKPARNRFLKLKKVI